MTLLKSMFFGAIISLACLAQADKYAIVVGNWDYSESPLAGPAQDCVNIQKVLEARGFHVDPLKNATREKLHEAFLRAKESAHDQFVFYYAGHGTRVNVGSSIFALVTVDGKDSDRYVTAQELRSWMQPINTALKTVILDACFSGGMSKAAGLEVRSWPSPISKGPVTQQDFDQITATDFPADYGICYVTAASGAEVSSETVFTGKDQREGVFTHFLCELLADSSKDLKWADICAWIRAKVVKLQHHRIMQTPQVQPAFHGEDVAFSTKTIGTSYTAEDRDVLLANVPPATELKENQGVRLESERVKVAVGEFVRARVFDVSSVGANLIRPVLLNWGREGSQQHIWPNGKVALTGDKGKQLDRLWYQEPGPEKLRAYYFGQDEDASQGGFIQAFKGGTGIPKLSAQTKPKRYVDVDLGVDRVLIGTDTEFDKSFFEQFKKWLAPPISDPLRLRFVAALDNVLGSGDVCGAYFPESGQMMAAVCGGPSTEADLDRWCMALNMVLQSVDLAGGTDQTVTLDKITSNIKTGSPEDYAIARALAKKNAELLIKAVRGS